MSSQLTRRDFIKVSFTAAGGLMIASYLDACTPLKPALTPTPSATAAPEPPFQPNLFIRIDPDGMTTLVIHRSEMGQGVRTSLAMILAEELDADWASIRVEQMDAVSELNQITSGSGSVTINYAALREAGATAREMLVSAAAQTWNVRPGECKAELGNVLHAPTGKKLGYGELVGKASESNKGTPTPLKDPKDFRLIGTSVPRVDGPNIVIGKAIYGLDVRVPGMLFATVERSPVSGAKLVKYDSTQAETIPGVRHVVKVSSGVAVVADNTWAAMQGRAGLKVTWDESTSTPFSSEADRQRRSSHCNRVADITENHRGSV
jgi:isoquinoline 1-oxidoreductase beta subunit